MFPFLNGAGPSHVPEEIVQVVQQEVLVGSLSKKLPTREGVPGRPTASYASVETPRPEVLTRSVERCGAKGFLISPSQVLGSFPALRAVNKESSRSYKKKLSR